MYAVEALNSQLAAKANKKKLKIQKINQWLRAPDSFLELYKQDTEGRAPIEDFIARQYHRVYQANIQEYMPQLVSFRCHNKLSAAVGFQGATSKPLFVEQYLDKSIELEIATHIQAEIVRKDIAEVGNLAASWKGSSQLIFVMLPVILERAGYKWVVLTATGLVERLLRKLYFKPITICVAEQRRVDNKGDIWGKYYQQSVPHVLTGSILGVEKRLSQHRLYRHLFNHFDAQINLIVKQLKSLK